MNKPLTKKEWEKSVAEAWSTAIEATYKDMIEKAVLEEREACAKVSEAKGLSWKSRHDINPDNAEKAYMASQFIASAIRARGEA